MDTDLAMAVVRLALGPMLFLHGWNKLAGPGGLSGTAGWFESLGFRPARLHAGLAAGTETAAGLLVTLGLLTGLAAAGYVGLMFVATLTDHRGKGYFVFKGGCEYTVLVGVVAVALTAAGPGAWSLDHLLGLDLAGAPWAVFAAVAGVAAGGALLATSYRPKAAD